MSGPGYQVSVDDGHAVMRLVGEVGIERAADLRSAGESTLADGAAGLVLDMSEVSFIDSAGIGAIVHLANVAGERGKSLRLSNLAPSVRRPFELSGLTALLDA